jgi:hypothetical protein
MTRKEAKIVLLEEALRNAQDLVEFLHRCLTRPNNHTYAFPERTEERLRQWNELAPIEPRCHHSGIVENCERCKIHWKRYIELKQAREILS